MKDVKETELPGVGVRFDVETDAGRVVGVVVHQTGRRDLVVYDELDPDRASESLELSEDEGHTIGDLLGGTWVLERVDDAVPRLDDVVTSSITIDASSPVAGLTLAEALLRTRTGARVVALVTDTGSIPDPGGTQRLTPGETAVVAGAASAVEAAAELLSPATAHE